MISINRCTPRLPRFVSLTGIVCLLASFAGVILVGAHKSDNNLPTANVAAPTLDATAKARITGSFAQLPLSFEINKGQLADPVKFLSHGAGYDLFLTANEAVLRVQKQRTPQADKQTDKQPDKLKPAPAKSEPDANVREGTVLRLKMLGANATPHVEGEDELPGKVNYFIGNNPEKWRRNVPTYRRVHLKEVYPGIDVVYYGKQRELEYDLVVAAGANPKLIRFTVEGADQIRLDKSGRLQLTLTHGDIWLNKPEIYQLDEVGSRREVKGGYVINGNEVRFKLERFDSTKSLVIDPVLSYATLLGSGSDDTASGIAVDSQGSAYVTGTTQGATFPTTPGAFKTTSSFGGGAFVTKLDPTGSTLIYSTYLSGDGTTSGFGIAVDGSGNAYVTGTTSASDFPVINGLKTTSNFFKTTDAAANWSNLNSGLSGSVSAIAVAPTAPNTIYAASSNGFFRSTDSGANWTKAAGNGAPSGGATNAMVVDPTNSSVVYLGHFFGLYKSTDGGDNWSNVDITPFSFFQVFSVVLDPATPSTLYVGANSGVFKSTNSGSTWTPQNNFGIPGTPTVLSLAIDPTAPSTIYAGTNSNGLFKSTNGGGVWTAMNNGFGTTLTPINTIAIDPGTPSTLYTGHGFGGGINKSTNGAASWTPLTNGVPSAQVKVIVATSSAVYAAFSGLGVIKTTNGGSSWTHVESGLWSPVVFSLAVHPSDSAVLYAGTAPTFSSDAFVTKLNSSGSGLLFSTLLGGTSDETGNGIAVDGSGNIYVAGRTISLNFPVVNALQPALTNVNDCNNGFVTKLNPAVPSFGFSTYLGGSNCDIANAIATDSAGNVYVTGFTSSTDFPTKNALQPTMSPGGSDAFVTKFTTDGALIYSTYLGGNNFDGGNGITADTSGNAYVTGSTGSTNFPTMNPIQASNGGPSGGFGVDAFVTKLNSQGSALLYSTYLGGSGSTDVGRGIAIDSANNVYVTGFTDSIDFPLVPGALRTRSSLYKSVDGAANWSNDNYGLGLASTSITSMVIDPTQPSTVYAGTLSGIYKTTNGGRTWSPTNSGLSNLNNIKLVINPVTPSIVYALAASSAIGGANGVYKSTDGGNNWARRSNGITSFELTSIAIDPVTPNTLYVSAQSGAGSRIYKTTDGGDNWALVGNRTFLTPLSLAIDPLNHATIYVADFSSTDGVFKSTDSGVTWQQTGFTQIGGFATSVAVSPLTPGLVYANNGLGLFKSIDGGNNWSPVPFRSGKIVFDPVTPSTVYLLSAGNGGVFKSTDNGQTWVSVSNGLNSLFAFELVIDPSRASTLYIASQGSGGTDAFVTKINAAGTGLIYSTFIRGPLPSQSFSGTNSEAFGIAVDTAGNAYVTGLASSGFPVTPDSYQPFNRGLNDAFVSKLGMSFIISGHVLDGGGLPVSGAEIVLNDGTSLSSVITESDGSYQFSRLREGGSFTVSASKPHLTMAPASQTFNNLNSDQVLDFTATATNAPFYTISGQITDNGTALSGVTVTLSGSQSGQRITDSNGNYSFELAGGGNYTVTPAIIGFTFTPPSQTFNNLSAPQTANFAATRQSFVVTNTNDHGSGSLRNAIINANATLGTDTIVFNIPGPGVKVISPLIALPEITERVVIDGTTQPGYAGTPLIEVDGLVSGNGSGFVIKAGGSTVRGLAINNFRSDNAIWLKDCNNNLIQGNYLGVAADGTTAKSNTHGILLSNSSNNVIGGTTAATRNVISGNGIGIEVGGNANIIQGNFIGTNAAGTAAVPNSNGGVGIFSSPFTENLIGGTAAGAGNLISGNDNTGISANGNSTTIQGNLIGTDVTGTKKLPNGTGIQALALNILIGGTTPGARNVISGNQGDGVFIRGASNKLQGNYIGTDITGTLALGNTGNGVVAGDGALIGGTVPEARNIISANGNFGNVALGFNSSGSAAIVRGNYIGTDVTGMRALGGSFAGVSILSNGNIIGGTVAGSGNVISGNGVGIQFQAFSGPGPGNVIQSNFIGVNAAGTGPLPNVLEGIAISGASNNTIGGTQANTGNTIAFNGSSGVSISSGTGNVVRRNSIFSNNALGIDLGANGVTPNDVNDADTGPNQLQNFPVITTVLSSANSTTIQGTLNSIPNTTFEIDFYSNAAVDPPGNGEGAQFFGTSSVNTNGNGDATINATFPVGLAAGRVITATATDPNGNTSEFSAADPASATGSVEFENAVFKVIEDIGMITLTVVRTGGTAGNLTVDYTTVDGTAIAGQDYTATAGTLNFSAGETSKTIQIPILDDATTEPDETFTVTLRNTPSLESLGFRSTATVTVQDHSTTPTMSILGVFVTEGGPGTTTDALFRINLSAATGRNISGNYITSNISAFGGTSCNNQGVDYESRAGTFSVQPGTTTTDILVKVCGDTSAEANETFRVTVSNVSGAAIFTTDGIGTIVNDDLLGFVLEDSGPLPNQAAALDALLGVRDPFRIMTIPDWFATGPDRNTRVVLFARNLQLNPGETSSAVTVRFMLLSTVIADVPAEDVRALPNTDLTQVIVRLPSSLAPGTYIVTIRAHTRVSNIGNIRIAP